MAFGFLACGSEPEVVETVRDPFIAMQSDFADLFEWPRWQVPDIGSTHGHRRGEPSYIYVRGELPAWGEPLPLGTIIAKTVEEGADPREWEIHAMVKRGGGFNAEGCAEWEWFDLRLTEDRVPVVVWRGEGNGADPGGYGRRLDGTPIGCNDCHAQVPHTDHTFARALYTPSEGS